MVAGLVRYTDDGSLDSIVRVACCESWITNYRLLVEFLAIAGQGNRVGPANFIPGWSPDPADAKRLGPEYGWASEVVSHIGPNRSLVPPVELTPSVLRAKTTVVFDVFQKFLVALAANTASTDEEDLDRARLAFCYSQLVEALAVGRESLPR